MAVVSQVPQQVETERKPQVITAKLIPDVNKTCSSSN